MISEKKYLQYTKYLDTNSAQDFLKEIEQGMFLSLQDEVLFLKFLKKYALKQNKTKAIQIAELFFKAATESNHHSREIIYLRIKSVYHALNREAEACELVLNRAENLSKSVPKSIISELRINYAMTCRFLKKYATALKQYHINLSFLSGDNSKQAKLELARTYCNIIVLYEISENEGKLLSYIEKLEKLLPQIKFDNSIYYQGLMTLTHIKFNLNMIAPSEAAKKMNEIKNNLEVGEHTFQLYLIIYAEADNNFAEAIKLSKDMLENDEEIPSYILTGVLSAYLKSLYHIGQKKVFLKKLDEHFSFLSNEKNLTENFLDLLSSKIEILTAQNRKKELVKLYKEYINFQNIIFEKNKKLTIDRTEIKLRIEETEIELNNLKVKAKSKEKLNYLLSEKNKNLESFASTTAHDLKSPIKTISMFIGMLEDSLELLPEEKEMFEYIASSSKRLNNLIDDLLSFANSGNFSKTKSEQTNINLVIEKVQKNIFKLLEQKEAKIQIENDLPNIFINPSAITVLLQNIVSNAIKFSASNRTPQIKIGSEIEGEFLRIYIQDNGLGIKKDDIVKIFSPFGRSTRTNDIEGSGLGLSTCLKIVKAYNGDITVNSKIDIGSTFNIYLPKKIVVLT